MTDAVSVERLLGKGADMSRAQPIEYCVVCGDKASGTNTFSVNSASALHYTTLHMREVCHISLILSPTDRMRLNLHFTALQA